MEQYRKPNMFYKKNGLSLFQNKQISILEIGFGTGLNAFITFGRNKMNQSIDYVRVEAYPVSAEELVP
jgi:tRNA U34 5-methylaminomethyl-2-thiouridine-forming methyltransferase MnmC